MHVGDIDGIIYMINQDNLSNGNYNFYTDWYIKHDAIDRLSVFV